MSSFIVTTRDWKHSNGCAHWRSGSRKSRFAQTHLRICRHRLHHANRIRSAHHQLRNDSQHAWFSSMTHQHVVSNKVSLLLARAAIGEVMARPAPEYAAERVQHCTPASAAGTREPDAGSTKGAGRLSEPYVFPHRYHRLALSLHLIR